MACYLFCFLFVCLFVCFTEISLAYLCCFFVFAEVSVEYLGFFTEVWMACLQGLCQRQLFSADAVPLPLLLGSPADRRRGIHPGCHSGVLFVLPADAESASVACTVPVHRPASGVCVMPTQCIGPVIWNSLSLSVRHSSPLSSFKSELKFSSAFL